MEKNYEILIETGRERTNLELYRWVDMVQELNVGEITVTEISREGRNKGFNVDLYKNLEKELIVNL